MDSLTQMALGAAIGGTIGYKKYGRKAAVIGAICGTVPDLDSVFFLQSDPITAMTYHRGFSHSILFALLATPLIAYSFSKIKWFNTSIKDKAIWWIVFLGLITHMIIDALTIYGTQLFWPFNAPPVGTGSIFIIDLAYTLPLLIGCGWFIFKKSPRLLKPALLISTLYLIWGLGVQTYIHQIAKKDLNTASYEKILVQTTPFNTLLWRVLVINDNEYKVGYISLFDDSHNIKWKNFERRNIDLKDVQPMASFQRFKWFTKDFYQLKQIDNEIILSDLRMGSEPNSYIFSFVIAQKNEDDEIIPIKPERYEISRNIGRLSTIWQRIWNEDIAL